MAFRICTVDHTTNSTEAVSVAIYRSAKSGDELLVDVGAAAAVRRC